MQSRERINVMTSIVITFVVDTVILQIRRMTQKQLQYLHVSQNRAQSR